MAHDIFTVMWKEWKELLYAGAQGGSRSGLIGLLIMIAIFGIVMPLQWGAMWLESAASCFFPRKIILPKYKTHNLRLPLPNPVNKP